MGPVVDVGAADAGPFHVYEDGVRVGEVWFGAGFVGYVVGFDEGEGEVLVGRGVSCGRSGGLSGVWLLDLVAERSGCAA